MVRGRGGAGRWLNTGGGRQVGATVRDRVNEALAELRRLTDDELPHALEELSDVSDVHDGSTVSVESVRRLRGWSADYLRLAAELEAAARCCRLVEQELRGQVDAPLASPAEQADAPGRRRSAERSGRKSTRAIGLAGWFRALSPQAQSAEDPRDDAEPAPPVAPEAPNLFHPPLPGRILSRRRYKDEKGSLSTVASAPLVPAPRRPEPDAGADVAAFMLGPLEVDVAGRRVLRWNSLKARAVFQYLLINRGRPVRRDVLMELQWPDHTHTSARNNLNVALHSLRNTLDGPRQDLQPVLYQDGCYVLNPELTWWVDRDEFLAALSQARADRVAGRSEQAVQDYQRAVQLYRGPLFEDDLSGDWYLPEQRHLTELYLQALEGLGEIHFERGELASAEFTCRLALIRDPCCEPVHRLLMRCYASEHKQQLVTRQYRLCVDALRDELGVSPGGETLRLFRELTSATP